MRRLAPALCALALLGGCGGDDDEETTVVETTTVPTVETVPETVPEPTVPPEPRDDDVPNDPANGGATAPSNCGRVTFEENTDSGAFEITAVGTDCTTARAVARAARNSTSELSFTARGFQCTGGRSEEPGLSAIEWFCFGADREVVTFATS